MQPDTQIPKTQGLQDPWVQTQRPNTLDLGPKTPLSALISSNEKVGRYELQRVGGGLAARDGLGSGDLPMHETLPARGSVRTHTPDALRIDIGSKQHF